MSRGLLPLAFCRCGATEPAQPDRPEEPPTLPCQEDADCASGLVCAIVDGAGGFYVIPSVGYAFRLGRGD